MTPGPVPALFISVPLGLWRAVEGQNLIVVKIFGETERQPLFHCYTSLRCSKFSTTLA